MSNANLNFNYKSKGMITERSQNARLFNAQEMNDRKDFLKFNGKIQRKRK